MVSEFAAECQAANRIAARLRGIEPPKVPRKDTRVRVRSRKGLSTVATLPQQRVLDFMREFFVRNDQLPPYSVIARHFGWKTVSCAQSFIARLSRKGLIERNEIGGWRFPRVPS